jgi:hypothetical protein
VAQQSSPATAIRALVMLSCLVVVPAVAVSGKSLPEMFERLVDRNWPAAVQEEEPVRGVAEDLTWRIPPESAYEGQISEELSGGWPAVEASADPQGSSAPPAAGLVPVHRSSPMPPAEPVADSPVPRTDGFREVEQRLRQLGATYYLLESWGQSKQLYRFYCRVAVTGSPEYTRYFEATDTDGLSAMREVMDEVEAWRARR